MVRIVSRGIVKGDREYRINCTDCGTVFEFKRSEAKEMDDQRDGNTLVINCPVCDRPTWVAP